MTTNNKDIVDNSPMSRSGTGIKEEVKSKAEEAAGTAQEKAHEIGQKVQDRADESLYQAAGSVEKAAEKVRERAEAQGGVAADAGVKLADGMEKTAGYLREHDSAQILDDVEAYVKEHPMQALAGALVGGFLVARILR